MLEDCSDANRQRVFAVNVDGIFRLSRASITMLKQAGRKGRIITTGAVCAEYGVRLQGAYVASRHAVAGLMKGLAILASDGGAYVTGQAITVDGGMTCRLPSLDHSGRVDEP